MSGMCRIGRMIDVKQKLKEIDTIMYEIVRDWRVSGFPQDNMYIKESCGFVRGWLFRILEQVEKLEKEARKSHITGE